MRDSPYVNSETYLAVILEEGRDVWEISLCAGVSSTASAPMPARNVRMDVVLYNTPLFLILITPLRQSHSLGSICIRPIAWLVPLGSASPPQLISCIALEGAKGIGGAMAFEVVPAVAGRLQSDQYSKKP